MPKLISIGISEPPYTYSQKEIKDFIAGLYSQSGSFIEKMIKVFDTSGIEKRSFVKDKLWYSEPRTFTERNEVYIKSAIEMSIEAVKNCLNSIDLPMDEIDHLIYISSTGISTPTIDAYLFNRFKLSRKLKRTPIWGVGCLGGAVGLTKAMEYTMAYPEHCVLVVNVEACSLAFQLSECSKSNIVASALFSDGGAASLIVGNNHPLHGVRGLELISSLSTTFYESLSVMGWEVTESGLKVLFSKDIPNIVKNSIASCIDDLMSLQGMSKHEISHYLVHPGGKKVLDAYSQALELDPEIFEISRKVLKMHGNMSSPSLIFVLKEFIESGVYDANDVGVISALGPGFSSELLLFEVK